ncbi:MAG TPA: hypothetical protein VE727_01610 [Solirubrobacterales bacterium]|jgi:hypothetical protein|nr:hypothetical protein [Solirubrobacterales bacterium]
MRETPQQRIWRERAEALIGLAAPILDLALSLGDRVSRVIAPGESDYYPIRSADEALELESLRSDGKRARASQTVD